MSKRFRPVPRLLATAAAAVILSVTLTGCGDMGAVVSKALREASTISHDLQFASRPGDVVISEAQKSGIAKYLAQLKAAQSPSTAAAEKTLGDVLKYKKTSPRQPLSPTKRCPRWTQPHLWSSTGV